MSWIRTNWNSLMLELRRQRFRLSLMIGLRRLTRWQRRMLPLMQALRTDLEPGPQPPELRILQELHLPTELYFQHSTLTWALQTTEDSYLLTQMLQAEMQEALRRTSKP